MRFFMQKTTKNRDFVKVLTEDNMKYVLVTGAYGGMGRATIEELRANGYGVFALDKKVGIEADGDGVIPLAVDVTDEASVLSAAEKVKSVTDELFAIIHFAGIYMLDSLVEMETADFEKIFEINVFGAFMINKHFLPFLRKGSKIIITTSELAPLSPLPFTGIYAVTKSALDKYAYSLRMELQLLGISVSVLRAGAVKTDMLGASTSQLEKFCNKTELYQCNADRFKQIVDSVEAKNIEPKKLAEKVYKIMSKNKPKFDYAINRNPLLRLLNILPKRLQFWIIRKILK